MRIIHFSDPHAGGPAETFGAYLDKRWVGVFNYTFRRKYQHDLTLLNCAVKTILDMKPDIAVCTGDITSTGQPGEFKKALDILAPLVEEKSIELVFVPGNHDYYVYNTSCHEALLEAFDFLNRGKFAFSELPFRMERADAELLVVNESWPTNLISSCGYLRREASDQILAWCAEPKTRPRIMISHFPLMEKHPWLRIRHRLWGQAKVLAELGRGNIDLSLCGHVHMPEARIDSRGRGEICAGSVTRNACMSLVEYHAENDIFTHEKIELLTR